MIRKYLLIFVLLFCASLCRAQIAIQTYTVGAGTGTTVTATPAINTTGAGTGALLVVGVTTYTTTPVGTLTDNVGNTWILAKQKDAVGAIAPRILIYYSYNATTSATHTCSYTTVTVTGFQSVYLASYSGAIYLTDPLDQTASNTGTSTSGTPGSVTPTQSNELIVTALCGNDGRNVFATINSGYTVTNSLKYSPANNFFGGMAYLIQTAAAAINPTWTFATETTLAAMAQVTFFSQAGASANSDAFFMLLNNQGR